MTFPPMFPKGGLDAPKDRDRHSSKDSQDLGILLGLVLVVVVVVVTMITVTQQQTKPPFWW